MKFPAEIPYFQYFQYLDSIRILNTGSPFYKNKFTEQEDLQQCLWQLDVILTQVLALCRFKGVVSSSDKIASNDGTKSEK
jgi:hypothetical protein